jgi:hypothetical protein
MNKTSSGILLALTLLGITVAAGAECLSPQHHVLLFSIAMVLMLPMCCLAEHFDGGIPRFYEDIHRADRR